MKDYLEQEGYEVKSPRSAIQTAFQIQLITDGHVWIDALNKRNLMAHTYDEEDEERAEFESLSIREYFDFKYYSDYYDECMLSYLRKSKESCL